MNRKLGSRRCRAASLHSKTQARLLFVSHRSVYGRFKHEAHQLLQTMIPGLIRRAAKEVKVPRVRRSEDTTHAPIRPSFRLAKPDPPPSLLRHTYIFNTTNPSLVHHHAGARPLKPSRTRAQTQNNLHLVSVAKIRIPKSCLRMRQATSDDDDD